MTESDEHSWTLKPVFGHLKTGLWHKTTIENLRTIYADGMLRPNTGDRDWSWPQSANGYAARINAVSVFDFESEPLAEIREYEWIWGRFLVRERPVSVLIGIDRETVADALVPADEPKRLNLLRSTVYIPRVEAWIRRPVPISEFRELLVICAAPPYRFCCVKAGPNELADIDKRVERFRREHDAYYENSRAGKLEAAIRREKRRIPVAVQVEPR